jgi:hypothetical protein
MNTRQWLISVISYYRNLEFFQQYSSLSDDQIADILENIQKNNEFDNGTFDSQREEDVIVLDENRIIPLCLEDIYIEYFNRQEDTKILNEISNANKTIKGILLELSYISRKIFAIKNIQFLSYKIGSESGDPVQIYFTQAESYQAACEEFFNPKDEISCITLKEFESSYLDECCCEDDSLENMITTFQKLNAVCGVVTPEGNINTIKEYGTLGYFYICFFINLIEEVNTNIFIAFPRYEGY